MYTTVLNFSTIIAQAQLLIEWFVKEECNVFYFFKCIMDENDALSEYNNIPLGHNRTNCAVYSKIYFKVEICSAH